MKKELSCIIVDDERQNQVVLEKMLDRFCPTVELLGSASSVQEGIQLIDHFDPDLVFLDIEMPEESGFNLLDKIEYPSFSVVFTTAHAEYALKAIKYAALDYLLKPINLTELKLAVEKVSTKIRESGRNGAELSTKFEVLKNNTSESSIQLQKLALTTSEGIEMVGLKNIMWCQANKNHTVFFLDDGRTIEVRDLLKDFENLLPPNEFKRVHKSHIVNINHVKKFHKGNGGSLLMSDHSEIDVAIRRKPDVINWLNQQSNRINQYLQDK